MTQRRNEELAKIFENLQILSSDFLSKLTDDELIKLRNELLLRKINLDAILKARIHQRTHFLPKD